MPSFCDEVVSSLAPDTPHHDLVALPLANGDEPAGVRARVAVVIAVTCPCIGIPAESHADVALRIRNRHAAEQRSRCGNRKHNLLHGRSPFRFLRLNATQRLMFKFRQAEPSRAGACLLWAQTPY